MPVIEAECASILVPHDHRQMKTAGPLSGHDQAPAATPIIQI